MEATKCDRCGKYVDGDNNPKIMGWEKETDAWSKGTAKIKMDLCPKCFEALEEFLLIKKEE